MKTNSLKIEFICGTTFDLDSNLLSPSSVEDARREAETLLLKTFGGFSQLTVRGAWKSPTTGQIVHDASLVYTVLSKEYGARAMADRVQNTLRALFGQESVPLLITEVFCKF